MLTRRKICTGGVAYILVVITSVATYGQNSNGLHQGLRDIIGAYIFKAVSDEFGLGKSFKQMRTSEADVAEVAFLIRQVDKRAYDSFMGFHDTGARSFAFKVANPRIKHAFDIALESAFIRSLITDAKPSIHLKVQYVP